MTRGWSEWRKFPDPRQYGMLTAPFSPGCYELRRGDTGKLICFGMGRCLALRMTSLLPKIFGQGTRKNVGKRNYILEHVENIEYRTLACATREEAMERERDLKANKSDYKFPT